MVVSDRRKLIIIFVTGLFILYIIIGQSIEMDSTSWFKKGLLEAKPVVILPNSSTHGVDMKSLNKILARYASKEKWILLSLLDEGFIDMGINFYESSLKKFGIKNYLFIGVNNKTCSCLTEHGIHCYVYKIDTDAGTASFYQSNSYLRKMHIRTYFIIDALNLGYSVLHSDVDVYFYNNPFKDFNYTLDNYDMASLWDYLSYNAGFLFIRNSNASKEVYQQTKQISEKQPKIIDQNALNSAIAIVKRSNHLKVITLPRDKYFTGLDFFERDWRNYPWDNPLPAFVVVHHTWLVSIEAKELRMKEMHMWFYEGKNKYYTHPDRKYLYFENPVKFQAPLVTQKHEINSLMNALEIGEILNRTVIYPIFHCGTAFDPCIILHHLILRQLVSVYPNYRESTFLHHPKVPKTISKSKSKVYFISSGKFNGTMTLKISSNITVLNPSDSQKGATNEEIKTWFGKNTEPILRFHSLYNSFCCFRDPKQNVEYQKKRLKAVKIGPYRQF